tara:strand:- start:194 stop:592 length:399 start_codon:yes stop_codon:yes gene_type:complete
MNQLDYNGDKKEIFKQKIFNSIMKLSLEEGEKKYYIFRSCKNDRNWFGINISKIVIEANNDYEMYIKLHNYMLEKQSYNKLFIDIDIILNDDDEEIYDSNGKLDYDRISFFVLDLFEHNNTFWYEKLEKIGL